MINCIVLDDEPWARDRLCDFVSKTEGLRLLGSFESPEAASAETDPRQIDLVFSDIAMGDMSGIDYLKSFTVPPLFVFITGHSQFAVESFELDVLDFILKPFDYARFLKSVDKARTALQNTQTQSAHKDFLVVRKGEKHVVIRYEQIYYVAGGRDYVTVMTEDGEYLMQSTLGNMENILPKESFRRVHKSYIINTDYMLNATISEVRMKGEGTNVIPIGKAYRQAFFDWLYGK